LLKALSDAHPNDNNLNAGALYNLCRIQYHQGEYNSCISTAKKALSVDPDGPYVGKSQNRIGHAYRRKGELTKAIEAYDAVSRNDPEIAPYALYNAGNIHLSKGNLSAASERFARLADEFPDSSETEAALKQLFIIAYRRGDYDTALKYTEELIKKYPDGELAGAAHFWQAKALSKLGRDIEASSALTYLTGHFQRSYYGIRAMEILGAGLDEISRIAFWSASDEGGGITGAGPARLESARELLRANIFDLALDEFASLPEGITPEADFTLVQNAYLAKDWHTAYKTAREFFARGYGNLLSGEELEDMLKMGLPLDFQDEINVVADRYGLDRSWLNGLILQESTFRPDVVSRSNAIGLMQVMPSTGTFIADLKGLNSFRRADLFDVEKNLDYGAHYFNHLLKQFDGDLMMTLTAYNGGPGNAKTWKARYYKGDMDLFVETIPADETRGFVRYVYTNIRLYQAIALREEGV
jgi:soluble lytic murein transglycosylase